MLWADVEHHVLGGHPWAATTLVSCEAGRASRAVICAGDPSRTIVARSGAAAAGRGLGVGA
jgi:hypothetical protein